MANVTKMPTSGEVVTRGGMILARVVIDGDCYICTNEGNGFPSKLAALDFINRTMREGASIPADRDTAFAMRWVTA